MKQIFLKLILTYQKTRFFRKHLLLVGSCRFTPTCSQYTYQAISKYGTIRGILLGFRRILNCHPWSKGGYDPVV